MLILAKPTVVAAGWSLIQKVLAPGGGAATAVTTPPVDTSAADLLIATSYSNTIGSLSDSYLNSWQTAVAYTGPPAAYLFYAQWPATVGINHTFTVTGDYCPLLVLAYRGSLPNGLQTTANKYDVTPTANNALIVDAISDQGGGITGIDSGMTIALQQGLVGGSSYGCVIATLMQTVAAYIIPRWQPANIGGACAAFLPAV